MVYQSASEDRCPNAKPRLLPAWNLLWHQHDQATSSKPPIHAPYHKPHKCKLSPSTMAWAARITAPARQRSLLPHSPLRQCNPIRRIATYTTTHHASLLSILPTNVDKSSADYRENAAHMAEVLARMEALHRQIEEGGPAKARAKHVARGKMPPRE